MAALYFLVAAVVLSGAALLPGVMAQSQTPPPKETIVYEHTTGLSRDDYHPTYDIYSVGADGTNVKALTNDGNSHSPSWSPDGRQILFVQDGATQRVNPYHQSHLPFGLYAMNRDGSDAHLIWSLVWLGMEVSFPNHAEWSPDGKMIVAGYRLSSKYGWLTGVDPPDPHPNVYLISANGQEDARLFAREASTPAWSPDGKKIAFSQGGAIQVMNTDGSGLVAITNSIPAVSPSWSPDGKHIAFAANRTLNLGSRAQPTPWPNYELFDMDSDGSHLRQLTTDLDWGCQFPSWSPDGKRVVFSCMSECTYSAGGPLPLPGSTQPPPYSQRIFVIPIAAPPLKLTPLIDSDGAAPVFAPSN